MHIETGLYHFLVCYMLYRYDENKPTIIVVNIIIPILTFPIHPGTETETQASITTVTEPPE
jgi:hypothetical protein